MGDLYLNTSEKQKFNFPFSYIILKNSFPSMKILEKDFPDINSFKDSSFRMNGDMTYPQNSYIDLLCRSKSYSSLHDFIYSKRFISNIFELFKDEIAELFDRGELIYNPFDLPIISSPYEVSLFGLNNSSTSNAFIYPRLDIGYGVKGYGITNGGAGIHTDNWGRLISILYYVNEPEVMIGGEHRLYELNNRNPVINKTISPEKGLMVASLQTNYALHDVNPITSITGSRNAFYIAISCTKPIWKEGEEWLMDLTSNRARKKDKSLLNKFSTKINHIFFK